MLSPGRSPGLVDGCLVGRHSGVGCARPGLGSGVVPSEGLPPPVCVPAGVAPLEYVPGWVALVAEKPDRLV